MAAAAAPSGAKANARSGLPLALMPAVVAEKRKPLGSEFTDGIPGALQQFQQRCSPIESRHKRRDVACYVSFLGHSNTGIAVSTQSCFAFQLPNYQITKSPNSQLMQCCFNHNRERMLAIVSAMPRFSPAASRPGSRAVPYWAEFRRAPWRSRRRQKSAGSGCNPYKSCLAVARVRQH